MFLPPVRSEEICQDLPKVFVSELFLEGFVVEEDRPPVVHVQPYIHLLPTVLEGVFAELEVVLSLKLIDYCVLVDGVVGGVLACIRGA